MHREKIKFKYDWFFESRWRRTLSSALLSMATRRRDELAWKLHFGYSDAGERLNLLVSVNTRRFVS